MSKSPSDSAAETPALEQVWISPPLDGPRTGGTLYNAALLRTLTARGLRVTAIGLPEARARLAARMAGRYWLDSLFLGSLMDLRGANTGRAPLGLVLHYLPSLVRLGRVPRRDELDAAERGALDVADAFVVPSPFMRDVVVSLGAFAERVITAVPGVEVAAAGAVSRRGVRQHALSALMIANAVPGKGIAPFLRALAPLAAARHFELAVVGDLGLDAAYAAECQALAATPALSARVRFEGPLPHDAVLQRLRDADVLVSASRMESFGMALAEARALGVPILALRAGNVPAIVHPFAGGESLQTDAEVAAALIRLAQDPEEREQRKIRARAERTARSWDDTASDYIAGLRVVEEATRSELIAASGLLVRP